MLPPNISQQKNMPQDVSNPNDMMALEATMPAMAPIGTEQVKKFIEILQKYKSGINPTKQRIIAAESWWKLRNTQEEQKEVAIGTDGSFTSRSGWMHNVIVSKHADVMQAYPEANLLPREVSDRAEARMLSAIVPCVMEQNNFEATYSEANWKKVRGGTGTYKVVWNPHKMGIGDIEIEATNILNLYWEPGVTNIQKSRYFFHTELWDKDLIEQRYPEQTKDGLHGNAFIQTKYQYDDNIDTENKVTVVDVYYHKYVNGKNTLQYCKFVNDIVLYATENDTEPVVDELTGQIKPSMAESGLYDHGKYPYVFDALFPIEGSPCGYGFVDICKNPQTEIDLLKTSFVKNAMAGSIPRYFTSSESSLNEDEFLNLSKPLVHLTNVREDALRKVEHNSLDGAYMNVLMQTIQELRETSGNTETSTGSTSAGVTAASAIAALQEASGKGSRDSTMSTYRAYSEIVEMVIELIRQFYTLPRKFRIIGEYGAEQYITYTNAGLQPQYQGNEYGQDMGYRLPIFDIRISPQRKSSYTKVSQNELALQFFQLGFFNPQSVDSSLLCLEIMDFDGKDEIMQKVAKNGTIYQKLVKYMQLALMLAQKAAPELVNQIGRDFMATTNGAMGASMGGISPDMFQSDNITNGDKKEATIVENARERSAEASQPESGRVISGGKR